MYNECFLDNKIRYICNNEYEYFLNKKRVQGVGLGFKEVNGILTSKKCFKVFVSKKLSGNEILKCDMIPKSYKGISTDVVESGVFISYSLIEKIRPALGGYSIGPVGRGSVGSIGCLVKERENGACCILSSNHVLADLGEVPIGAPVVQPSIYDGGTIKRDVVATLRKYTPIKFEGWFWIKDNYVDAAIATVSYLSLVSSKIAIIDKAPVGSNMPVLGEKVYKVGRSTEETTGNITAIDVTVRQRFNRKRAIFKDQIITNAMSMPGDSGSTLLNDKLEVIGLLMAGSNTNDSKSFSIYNRIDHVLFELNVEVVNTNSFFQKNPYK